MTGMQGLVSGGTRAATGSRPPGRFAQHPGTRVVHVTVHDDAELAERGCAAGAPAYVLKITASHDLVPAVHAAMRGERYTSQRGRGAQA